MLSELCFGLGITSAIILAHNHLPGQLKPSDADLKVTQKLKEGGKFLEIPVLDHIMLPAKGIMPLLMKGCYSPFYQNLDEKIEIIILHG